MSYVLGSSATNLQNKKQNAINLTEKLSKRLHFYYKYSGEYYQCTDIVEFNYMLYVF